MFSSCISFRWLDCTCNKLLQLHFCCSLLLTFIGCHSCWALALVPHAFPKHALHSITDLVAFINLPLSVKNMACETRPTKRGEVTDLVATTLYLLCDTNWVVTGRSTYVSLLATRLKFKYAGPYNVAVDFVGSWFNGSWSGGKLIYWELI